LLSVLSAQLLTVVYYPTLGVANGTGDGSHTTRLLDRRRSRDLGILTTQFRMQLTQLLLATTMGQLELYS